MRVALVHDFLTQKGGAERVVLHLARTFDDPTIFTSLYAPEDTYPEFKDHRVVATRHASGAAARRFRARALSYPGQFRAIDLSDFDLVLVSSSCFAHHVAHPRSAVYWHTPPRFLYDASAYVRWGPAAQVAALGLSPLRRPDRLAARGHRTHAANSKRTARRLEECYGIDASVLHPPLDVSRLDPVLREPSDPESALVVSRLLPYKRLDVAIAACRSVGVPLTIIGDGPDRQRLGQLADRSVSFLSSPSDREVADAYTSHALVLCPGQDDFGYIPLEAAYAGRPVVASNRGGAVETVVDGVTGLLVDGWDPGTWAEAIRRTLVSPWDRARLRGAADRFSTGQFDRGLARWLSPMLDGDRLPLSAPVVSRRVEPVSRLEAARIGARK